LCQRGKEESELHFVVPVDGPEQHLKLGIAEYRKTVAPGSVPFSPLIELFNFLAYLFVNFFLGHVFGV
jgi:hypothetical protein